MVLVPGGADGCWYRGREELHLGDAGAANYTVMSQLLWTQLRAKLKQMQNYILLLSGISRM